MTAPRIYVASLSDYNAGRLHGTWIDLEGKDADDINREITAMLQASPEPGAEEWAIHDHEGLGNNIDEWHDFDEIVAIASLVKEHGYDVAMAALACFVQVDFAEKALRDGDYIGHFDNVRELGAYILENYFNEVPRELQNYIDIEAIARDFELNDFTEHDGHYFHNS